jgi:hypothetical protein
MDKKMHLRGTFLDGVIFVVFNLLWTNLIFINILMIMYLELYKYVCMLIIRKI